MLSFWKEIDPEANTDELQVRGSVTTIRNQKLNTKHIEVKLQQRQEIDAVVQ